MTVRLPAFDSTARSLGWPKTCVYIWRRGEEQVFSTTHSLEMHELREDHQQTKALDCKLSQKWVGLETLSFFNDNLLSLPVANSL